MADFIDIIKEKNRRLESVPDKFLSSVKKSERQVYENIILLLGQLKLKNGQILGTIENLNIAAEITAQLKQALYGSEYLDEL